MHLRHFALAAGFLGIPLGIAVLAAQEPQVLTPAGGGGPGPVRGSAFR